MKFCKDCEHFKMPKNRLTHDCWHPGNVVLSPVLGVDTPELSANSVREYETRPTTGKELCGPQARWFKARLRVA